MDSTERCPCGKGESLATCCGPLLTGDKQATTAEELMRSRYSAFATANVDYIVSTHHPKGRDELDRDSIATWAKESEWLGMEIQSTEQGGADDTEGVVEFEAKYKIRGATIPHREKAYFTKEDGRWFFVDGKEMKPEPAKSAKVVGRNDPCTCGSGKKFKKCCGKAA